MLNFLRAPSRDEPTVQAVILPQVSDATFRRDDDQITQYYEVMRTDETGGNKVLRNVGTPP
jgi:hypothetical protein